ncbi:RICIN domain-containing protein [Hymenobacter sp. BT491]|uniref:RICIN domain-containing protein n=1 Tax=Hymenobacter sp. BT491 TaxID=2766779 RepID=UPI001653BF64|nr:RICIN domain-containing protein [Hymenobacter sp. BT491]MBC6988529.1 RICIN domain-containing protein [Hymenobacter sp. BT491]
MNHSLFRSLFLLFVLLTTGPLQAQQVDFTIDESAWYGIIARSSGLSLDVTNSSAEAGAATVQWEFTHSPSQQWRFVRVTPGSVFFRIEAKNSGKCLTSEGPAENAALVQRPWSGSLYQQWALVPAGPMGSLQLVSRGNDKCAAIATADKANGTPVVSQKPANRATQQWRLFKLRLTVDGSQYGTPEALSAVSTPGNELQPVITPDNRTLYLTRTKYTGNTEGNTDSGDIWVSTTADNGKTWGPATRLDALNTPQNNGVMAVVGNGNTLVVRGTYERDGSFRDEGVSQVARNAKGKAAVPQPLDIENYYSAGTATTFFQTPDEKVLLLSLERADSQGLNDLYVSLPAGDGSWTEPRSLGSVVNSPGFEFAPWLSPDGKRLYFSSYGHAGYGSADIFVSNRLDESWTNWSEPRNLGAPINGAGFDAYFILEPNGKHAFFASSRTPNGPTDLYRAEVGVAPVVAPADTAKPAAPPVAVRTLLTGHVLDAGTRKPIAAEVKVVRLGDNIVFNATARSEPSGGNFQFSLPAGQYRITAISGGFLTATDTVRMVGSVSRDLLLVPAAVGSRLELPTLIFAQGKYDLLPASYSELNRLARTLIDNPAVNIRLEGHTDNVGPADKNLKLSEDRVAEVKRYLVTRGIGENRITTVGYGGSKPRASNAREETRRLNRRVEFTITNR